MRPCSSSNSSPARCGVRPEDGACRPRAATAATTPSAPIHLRRTPRRLNCSVIRPSSLRSPLFRRPVSRHPRRPLRKPRRQLERPPHGRASTCARASDDAGRPRRNRAVDHVHIADPHRAMRPLFPRLEEWAGWRDPEARSPASGRAPHCAVRIGECPSTFVPGQAKSPGHAVGQGDRRAPTVERCGHATGEPRERVNRRRSRCLGRPSGHRVERAQVLREPQVLAVVDRHLDQRRPLDVERAPEQRGELRRR